MGRYTDSSADRRALPLKRRVELIRRRRAEALRESEILKALFVSTIIPLVLRIRDDCELFNVREKGEAWMEDSDDLTSTIGIRMVMGSAKDLKYVNTLGTNSLIITV